jgi:transposase
LTSLRFGSGIEGPIAWLSGLPGPVRACYEAGPTGFGLYRAASAAGIAMQVIAPGKTPRGPSDRVKTDRKDAELLARLLLAGSLTRVVVPAPEVEAAREMTRAHDACRRDLMNARHRVSKMLLRHGRVYPKPTTWTAGHRKWLSVQQFDEPASSLVFADLIAAVDGLTSRKAAIALRLSELASDERWWPTALSAWLGLTPSLEQSGESSRHGAITKTGSMLARRLLVESAWHYSRQPRLGATLANRQAGQPDHILQISNRAQQRLHTVNRTMKARGKPHNVVVVACARQLACFLWAAATAD